jgi:uncharacterized protein (TIGR02266 family)
MTVSDVTPIETDPNFGRRQGRLDLDVAVHLSTHEGGSLGVAKNVSSGGMFVATSRLLSVGDQVAVCLSMLDEAQIVEAEAEVRWLRRLPEGDGKPAGMGLRFVDRRPEATAFLRSILRLRTRSWA